MPGRSPGDGRSRAHLPAWFALVACLFLLVAGRSYGAQDLINLSADLCRNLD